MHAKEIKSRLQNNARQILLYLITGVSAFIIDYSLFLVLLKLVGAPLYIANTVALVCGFLASFFGNRLFVFGSQKLTAAHSSTKQFILYIVLLTINSVLSWVIIKGFVSLGVEATIGKIFSMAVIVLWNFIVYKKIIFKSLN